MTTDDLLLFPLTAVLFPGGPMPLRIFEPRYLDMVSRCMKEERPFGILLSLPGTEIGAESAVDIGTTARISDWYQGSDGILGITAVGMDRFRLRSFTREDDGLYVGSIELLKNEICLPVTDRYRSMSALLKVIINDLGKLYEGIETHYENATWLGHRFAEILPISLEQKQHCLEIDGAFKRLAFLQPLLRSIRQETSQ